MIIKNQIVKYVLVFISAQFCIQSVFAQQTATDFFNISSRAMKYQDYDNVILFANKALELDHGFGGAYWNRAIAHDQKGNYSASVSDYDSAIKYYTDEKDLAVLHKNKGMVYNDMKAYDSALAEFAMALNYNPDFGLVFWNKGLSYDGLRKPDSAIRYYTLAMKYFNGPDDKAELYLLRGEDYKQLSQTEKAVADFKHVKSVDSLPDYQTALAEYFLGNKTAALDRINQFVSNARSNVDKLKIAYMNAASVYAVMEDHELAMKYIDYALSAGYKNYHYLSTCRDFDHIRDDEGFRSLIAKYNHK